MNARKSEKLSNPDWYKPELYAFTKDLDAQGWYRVLRYRKVASGLIDKWLEEVYRLPEQLWEEFYLVEVVHAGAEPHFGTSGDIKDGLPKPFHQIDPDSTDEKLAATATVWHWLGHGIIVIDPNAPDVEIRQGFESWLTELRAQHPLPIKVRGPKSTKTTLTPNHFSRWRSHKVLEQLDLQVWSKTAGSALTHSQRAALLFPDNARDPKDVAREAQASVEEAIAAVHALSYVDHTGWDE